MSRARTRLLRRTVLAGLGAGFTSLAAAPIVPQPDGRGVRAVPSPPAAVRSSPPQLPILMPGTAMHVGPVRAVAVSPDGTVVATGSTDRSVRLWSVATGECIGRLHLPVGEGAIGVVDAVAFGPGGRQLYVAGLDWASEPGQSRGMGYVFNLGTGTLVGLMAWPADFGSRLRTLSVSPSGRQIAIAAGNNGLVVRDTEPGAYQLRFAEPPSVSVATSAVGYSPDGRWLATAASSGALRLFAVDAQGGVREAATRSLPGGGQPNSLAFSADGERIAVGFTDRPHVLIVSSRQGAPAVLLGTPAGSSAGNLAAVAWARGEAGEPWLFAGGTVVDAAGRNLVFGWRDGRPGSPAVSPVSRDSITQLVPHPSAGVAFGSSDPRWGFLKPAADGRTLHVALAADTERLDFRGAAGRGWGIDAGGGVIEFRGGAEGASLLRFDLAELTLSRGAGRGIDLTRPRAPSATAPPAGFNLARGTLLRSEDRAPDLNRALFGTDDYLILADQSGRELARRDIATAAWGVALARGRRVAIAAHGDGTVRWYSLDPERPLAELGGLFVAADEQRWLAWRADGRFAHSSGGGAKLVGFLQNGAFEPGRVSSGGLTGRWLDIDQLYRRLYDPDKVRRMLDVDADVGMPKAKTEIRALKLPSINIRNVCAADDRSATSRGIRLVSALTDAGAGDAVDAGPLPADTGTCRSIDAASAAADQAIMLPQGTTAMRVQLSVDAAGTTQVAAFVNEQNVSRSVVGAEATRGTGPTLVDQHVPLFPGENRVEFRAYLAGTQDFSRAPTILRVSVAAPAATQPAAVAAPTLRALVVGVDAYGGTIHPLRFAKADAESFAGAIQRRSAREYGNPVVTTLFDRAATAQAVTAGLAEIATESRPQDAVVLYFAGHGVVGDADKSYAFLTADVDDATAALRGGQGLGADRLARGLAEIRAERVFVFLDTCYAGAFDPRTIGYFNHDTGRYVLAASTRLEEALDGYDGVNGLFACAVKEGLDGRVGRVGRSVDAFDLGRYVTTRVEEMADAKSWHQRAVFQAAGRITAFPLVAPPP